MELKKIKKIKYYLIFALIILVCIFLDQFSKILTDNKYIAIINNFLWFESTHNTGAAYGSFAGKTLVLIILTIVVLSILIFYYIKNKNKNILFNFAIGFIVGGAIGNLIDRFFRGFVVDFIDTPFIATFNIADSCVVIAAIMLIIYFVVCEVKESRKEN